MFAARSYRIARSAAIRGACGSVERAKTGQSTSGAPMAQNDRTFMNRAFLFAACVLLLGQSAIVQQADEGWPMHGGVDNIRYSPLAQINRDNVTRLQVAWTYDSHDAFKGSEMQSNPVIVDGVLYATTPTLKVIALDASTGRERWKFDPSGGATG